MLPGLRGCLCALLHQVCQRNQRHGRRRRPGRRKNVERAGPVCQDLFRPTLVTARHALVGTSIVMLRSRVNTDTTLLLGPLTRIVSLLAQPTVYNGYSKASRVHVHCEEEILMTRGLAHFDRPLHLRAFEH